MNIEKSLLRLKRYLVLRYGKLENPENSSPKDLKQLKLIHKINDIVCEILMNVANGEAPVLKSIFHRECHHCVISDSFRINKQKPKVKRIDFKKATSRSNFATVIFLLSKIYKLVIAQKTSTRRELYYKNVKFFESQRQVDCGMREVSHLLNVPSWELRVLATSKGIIFGPLILKLADGAFLDCGKKGGVAVPSNVSDIKKMSSSATWVLIIEKDAAFQNIINLKATVGVSSCIFITGKGYPDVNTRLMVCKLWEHLRIPMLALVDADPHGFEIMSVYRFGSANMRRHSKDLACPAVRWLGVHPSDIKPLLLNSKNLSFRETQKIRLLLQRHYVLKNTPLKTQLEILLCGNVKAEIEEVSNISLNYLTEVYLKSKIHCREYL